ncbi:hypothetical protein BP6252_02269 [Coleophoma cylindrospora]|uniref:Fe2OG dioxygenase domain-containing protein n=1 Tax=Coleophoma cylindrospora TaxID=1849047 RepID=A0A3D8SED7_9HELO|nr:hypothetical protein BP6252_02269 [Coleophoma cylindrospora]
MATQKAPNRVYYIAGGYEQSRPILTGSAAKKTFDTIPVVDVSNVFSFSLEERQAVAKEVGRAAEEVGFFYAVNPPVSKAKMDKAFEAIKKFFDQSDEEKLKYHVDKSPAVKGFHPFDKEKVDASRRESFGFGNDYTEPEQHVTQVAPLGTVQLNQWPDETIPELRKVMYEYYREVYDFGKKMIQIFALALGLEENELDNLFRYPLTDVTVQHYPAQAEPTAAKEILYAHADYGALTFLLQNKVPGLEVLNANGVWVPCPPMDHAYVINTGNYLEVLSNSRFPSTVHRVFSDSSVPRFSLPFFLSPDPSAVIVPHPRLVPAGEIPKHEPHDIGARHVKGMMYARPEHPYVKKLAALGLAEKDYRYELLSQPMLAGLAV